MNNRDVMIIDLLVRDRQHQLRLDAVADRVGGGDRRAPDHGPSGRPLRLHIVRGLIERFSLRPVG